MLISPGLFFFSIIAFNLLTLDQIACLADKWPKGSWQVTFQADRE